MLHYTLLFLFTSIKWPYLKAQVLGVSYKTAHTIPVLLMLWRLKQEADVLLRKVLTTGTVVSSDLIIRNYFIEYLWAVPTKSVDICQICFYVKHHTGDKEVDSSFKWFIWSINLRLFWLKQWVCLPSSVRAMKKSSRSDVRGPCDTPFGQVIWIDLVFSYLRRQKLIWQRFK